jgi:hypothetical protein
MYFYAYEEGFLKSILFLVLRESHFQRRVLDLIKTENRVRFNTYDDV